jgi:hypothetical protein
MPQPLWNIESLENLSQIVPKGLRSCESYVTEKTSRDKDRASVSKGVAFETNICSRDIGQTRLWFSYLREPTPGRSAALDRRAHRNALPSSWLPWVSVSPRY